MSICPRVTIHPLITSEPLSTGRHTSTVGPSSKLPLTMRLADCAPFGTGAALERGARSNRTEQSVRIFIAHPGSVVHPSVYRRRGGVQLSVTGGRHAGVTSGCSSSPATLQHPPSGSPHKVR